MAMTPNGHADVLRMGLKSNIYLGDTGHCKFELKDFLFHGETSEFDALPVTTTSQKLLNIASQWSLDCTEPFGVYLVKTFGGVC